MASRPVGACSSGGAFGAGARSGGPGRGVGAPRRVDIEIAAQRRVGEGDHFVDHRGEDVGELGGVRPEAASVPVEGARAGRAVVVEDVAQRPQPDAAVLGRRGQGGEQVGGGDVVGAGQGPDVGVVADLTVAGAELDRCAELLGQDDGQRVPQHPDRWVAWQQRR